MESIISSLQGAISYAVPMIVLLGLLIFVHELGHFLVAKYFKVRVEVFSLGFGPKLFKFKRGDTVYAISAIPLGGYVKMFGDDPTAEIPADQKRFSFTSKPVGQRIAVVLAGPIMNLFFAIVLFSGVASLGEQALAPKIGDVEPQSDAFQAGFRSGDSVISVGGEKIRTWDEFQHVVEANADHTLSIAIQHADVAAQETPPETLQVMPKLAANKTVLSWDRQVGEVDGLNYVSRAAVIGIRDPNSLAAKAGLKTGDIIQSVNGEKLTKWRDLAGVLKKYAPTGTLNFEVERGILDDKDGQKEGAVGTTEKIALTLPAAEDSPDLLQRLGIEFPELYLASLEKHSPAESAGLKKGDRLLSIDNKPVQSFEQVASIIRSFGQSSQSKATTGESKVQPLAVTVLRDGKEVAVSVAPNIKERMSAQGREEKHFEIGIRPLIIDATPATIDLAYSNPIDVVKRGFSQTIKWTSLTVLSFVRLFYLSIGQMAKRSWAIGPSQFLNVMAIISINLFILNLLPVPVLDGGHLVFYTFEAVRGAPLSMRKMEIAQQVGLFLLLGLMVFALFNDFSRLFS